MKVMIAVRERGNLKVRGKKEKVVEDKGEGRTGGQGKGSSRKEEGKADLQYDRSKRNEWVLYQTAWMEAAAYFRRRY